MRTAIGIGESVLDVIFQSDRPQQAVPGGSVFNCIVSLARCGLATRFITELGNDRVGRLIGDFIKTNGINTDSIYFFDEGQTPVSMAFLDEQKNAEYVFYKDFPMKRLNITYPNIAADDVVVFGSYFAVNPILRDEMVAFLNHAHSGEALLYYDINFRKAHAGERLQLLPLFIENFELADVIRCSDEDLSVLFPQQNIDAIYDQYFRPQRKPLIITQGARNILVKTPNWEMSYPVEPITPVSTIGAGDNFNAGWILGLMRENISRSQINELTENQWNLLIDSAKKLAKEVCLSMENYISVL